MEPAADGLPVILGYLPTSMCDWDGHLAQVLFLPGCNYRCPFCHNPDLVRGEGETFAWEDISAAMERHKGWVHSTVITGGEPTLHDGLPALCRLLKARQHAVKLDTNGARPDRLRQLCAEQLVDYVAMDIKTAWPRYPQATGVADTSAAVQESFALLRDSGIDYELRTTVVPGLVSEADIAALAPALAGAKRWLLQAYRAAPTLDPAYSALTPPVEEELARMVARMQQHGHTVSIRNK